MKIRKTYETETFMTEGGYFAIKQPGWPEEDQTVLLSLEQLKLVLVEIQNAISSPELFDIVEEK